MDTNYFTCTLGEATEIKSNQFRAVPSFLSINDLIDKQAEAHTDDAALGITKLDTENGRSSKNLYSFNDLRKLSIYASNNLDRAMNLRIGSNSKCVALLCPSGIDFVMAWLGLIRAGCSVLLIAPQCQPAAIAYLCKSCQAGYLVYDRSYTALATATSNEVEAVTSGLKLHLIPWQSNSKDAIKTIHNTALILTASPSNTVFPLSSNPTSINDITYIHHTSGTSTGLPKPIPQTQYAAVGVQACIETNNSACFSTTPLYHGGIADCFRAWTSGALIWIFSEAEAPITTRNIISALQAIADANTNDPLLAPLIYFSCVPYVLQMLAEEIEGLRLLRAMNIVGVGGAALPAAVGDSLVREGVNLISRYGTAELGFLLSSYRIFNKDQDWEYLRLPSANKYLRFEKQDDGSGLSELVVLKGWPYMAKVNREDGSFATRDLFEPHPTTKDAWRYHSRSDSQITLVTGKKFDPAPLEDEIKSSSPLIRDILIFGNGQQRPGALIFVKEDLNIDEAELKKKIWETVQLTNTNSPQHAQISKDLLQIIQKDSARLEKSSKGSLLRSSAEKKFADEIRSVYEESQKSQTETLPLHLSEEEVKKIVRETIFTTMESIPEPALKSGSLCKNLKKFSSYVASMPWNIVYDCGSIEKLTQYLMNLSAGREAHTGDTLQEMQDFVKKYSSFEYTSFSGLSPENKGHTVVLTGATGMLGSQVLYILNKLPSVSQIICLLRSTDLKSAKERVSARLVKNKREPLGQSDKILCWPSTLQDADLGLQEEQFIQLRQKATHIIHAAWPVNFSLPLRSFESQLASVRNLISVAQSCAKQSEFIFCSSTSSVACLTQATEIPEMESKSPSDADRLGYSKSKWVAERICSAASMLPNMAGKVKIFRVGQLTGDTEKGVWNMTEAWPLMLSTLKALGCLPKLSQPLNWLPVDVAAEAVVELALKKCPDRCSVYHIVNKSTEKIWLDLLGWLQEFTRQKFDVVDAKHWLSKLEKLESHPAQQLLELWKAAYGGDESRDDHVPIKICTKKTERVTHALRRGVVDKELSYKIWRWLEESHD
ncbi:hypothetical protein K3495_g969 [Podosphaera aphanis]|nr:hypothetical protein K3495_g969 [Podosphaera aphanis]